MERTTTYLRLMVAMVLMLAVSAGTSAAQRGATNLAPLDEDAVYAALLDQMFNQGHGWVLLSNRSVSFACNDSAISLAVAGCTGGLRTPDVTPSDALKKIGQMLPGLTAALLDDFGSKNQSGTALTPRLPVSRSYIIGLPTNATSSTSPDYWLFPSHVGFAPDHRSAVVYVGVMTWLNDGLKGGFVVLLRRMDDKWIVEKAVQTWQLNSR